MTDEELIEAVAEVIAGFSRPHENAGVATQYAWERAYTQARAVIPVAQAPLLARIAEVETALETIRSTFGLDLAQGYKTADKVFAYNIARNALRSTQ